MDPIAIVGLGAGAFVTTAAAGVVLLRRKMLSKAVEVDVEKGLEENAMERRETGPGWKEYTEVDEKATSELLVPLVRAFQSQKEADVTDASPSRTPLSPEPHFPALQQCPDISTPNVQQQANPLPVLEGDISDRHDYDHAPAFPPGLPVPAKVVAVARPIPGRLNPLSELGPLDTGVSGITSWPVLAPTPVEEMRTRANGKGEPIEPDVKGDVVPQVEPSASSIKSPCEPTVAPISPSLSVSSRLSEAEVDPFADPVDSVYSPHSEAFIDIEAGIPLASTPRSAIVSLDDLGPQPSDAGWPEAIDSTSGPPILCPTAIEVHDAISPANIPLPESPPMSPMVVSPLIHTLPLDTVATTAVVFGEELSPNIDISDNESSSPIVAVPSIPVLAPIVTISCVEGVNEAPRSPLSDTTSSSDSDSPGPETPTELKHDLPFSPALDLSSKDTPRLQLPICLPSEDVIDDDDVEVIDDFVIVGQQAPPSPTIDVISPEWKISKLPGSFEDVTNDRTPSDQKPAGMIAATDVPPLTADMIQLCHALLAVSNCAGLVAQAVVGFSVWWSLTLVPA